MSETLKQPNELRVTLPDFKRALKFFRRYDKGNPGPEALISCDGGYMAVEVEGQAIVIHADGEWNGRAIIGSRYLAALHYSPPLENPVVIRYAEDRLRVSTLSIPCRWSKVSDTFIRRTENPSMLDLLAFDRAMPRAEIYSTGIAGRIIFAKKEAPKLTKKAARMLAPLGISEGELVALVERHIQARLDQDKGGSSAPPVAASD